MTGYAQVFGGETIYPANALYLAIALTADSTLEWPLETAAGSLILATVIEATPDAAGRNLTLPDARQGSPGSMVAFTNLGADTFGVKDSTGATVLSVASGQTWILYLRDNSTAAGSWRAFQMGAGVSTANAASLVGAGIKAILSSLNQKMDTNPKSANYPITNNDRAVMVLWTGGVGIFTLPDPATVGTDWFTIIKNGGSGSLTVNPTAGLIDGAGSLILATGESAFFVTDGANFYTVGLGQEVNSVFDFISINVAGTGDYVLSGIELNRVAYRFTGILTGNRNIIVPASVQQYWCDNQTTGAFTLTVKTALGTGKVVAQGNRAILFCDGTNVLDADSSSFTPPLAVASGGTGATTAANARANLGSTTIGDALFITLSAAAARSTLGSTATGDALFTAASAAAARGTLGSGAVGDTVFTAATQQAARNALGIYTAVKAAAEDRTSTTVLTTDSELNITNLPGNKRYMFEAFLPWTQQGATTNGFKVAPAVTGTGFVPDWAADTTQLTSVANQAMTSNADGYNNQLSILMAAGGSTGQFTRIFGSFQTTGAGVGSLGIAWAQNTSDATATRMFAGAWLRIIQLN